MVKWRSPPKCAYLAHNRTRFCCEPKFFSFVDTLKRFPNSITKNGGLDMKKPYLFIITVYYVSVFCLGIGAQSPAKPPFDDPRVERLKGAVFQLCDAAINYAAKGQYDRAIALFSKALEINPRYAEAYNNRGIAYAKGKGQYDKAISDYDKAIEINPRYAEAYNNRAIAYCDSQKFDKAISDYTKAIEINPRYTEAYNNRGVAYEKKGQFDKAISDFSIALEINPRYAEAYNNRGIAYAKGKGQYEKALSDFLKAIEINPVNADIYDNRGITYERLGDKEKACSDWKKACQLGSCKAYEAAKRKDDC